MGLPSFFTEDEIQCKCGCGFKKVVPHFFYKMNLLRYLVAAPMHVTSWCRCLNHNKKEGGSHTSSHPRGEASDIFAPTDQLKYRIVYFAGRIGFRGIGVAKTFVHLDDDFAKPDNRLWFY